MLKIRKAVSYLLIIIFICILDLIMDNIYLNYPVMHEPNQKILFRFIIFLGVYSFFAFLLYNKKTNDEKKLLASEEHYRNLFDASLDIIFTLSAKGRFIMINQTFERVTGFSREQWLGKSIVELIHTESKILIQHKIDQIIKESSPTVLELQIISRHNQDLFFDITLIPKIPPKKPREIYGVARNITARKKAERDLAAQKERLAVTLRSIGDGVIATDIKGKIVLINPIAEQWTGWTQNDAIGESLNKVFNIINDITEESCENPIEKVLNTGESVGLAKNTVLVSRNGKDRYFISNNGSPIRDSNGQIIGAVLVFRDISERRRSEEAMMKNQKLESIGILAGGIAHDFNNILAGILANTQLAKLIFFKGKNIEKYLNGIEEAVGRAVGLTRQLMTFSKGGAPIRKICSMVDLLRTTVDFTLRGSNVKCELAIPDDLWPVEIDTGQIEQVINNLIINADQAMPEGGFIYVSAENVVALDDNPTLVPGKFIKITIRDQGCGIPEENLSLIFDPYFTTKASGSGLGLATSYSIIKKHGGYLEVQSKLKEGTTFTIYLSAAAQKPDADVQTPSVIMKGEGRILLMDDDQNIRDGAGQMLSLLGYEVEFAQDGQEVIELYQKNLATSGAYDLVIMDLTIPGGMGGKYTIDKLLKIDPSVKVIVSSGYSNNPVMAEYQKYGFSGVVEKPYKIEELSQVLYRLLSK